MTTFDARAWLAWLAAGSLSAILIGNPLYLLLLLLISRVVEAACAPPAARGRRLPLGRLSLMILVFSTLFNVLMAHYGRTVLWSLPAGWPLIGGPLTLEAAVFGFINGLRLVTMLSFFMAFNTIVPVHELAGLTPRALHELGLVLLIAITYIPETTLQYRRIRDAQAIRGHEYNGLRAWRPIIIPLLIAGLERALNLSETMVARGYGSTGGRDMTPRARLLMPVGLLLALAGALRLSWGGPDGWLLVAFGALTVAVAWRDLGRLVVHTRYRPRRPTWADGLVALGAIVALLPLIWPMLPGTGRSLVAYSPYPQLTMPPFNLWVGLGLFGLVVPAVLALTRGPVAEVAR